MRAEIDEINDGDVIIRMFEPVIVDIHAGLMRSTIMFNNSKELCHICGELKENHITINTDPDPDSERWVHICYDCINKYSSLNKLL
jgi:hypothetical protein